MNTAQPLRLVLMDGRLAGESGDHGTMLIASRNDVPRQVTLAAAAARAKRAASAERSSFARFCLIGAFGFAIDAGALFALVERFHYGPIEARAISVVIAVTATWLLHRRFTFRSTDPRRFAEWLRFLGVNGVGTGVNVIVYTCIMLAIPGTPPILALVMGSAVALAANYLGSRRFAFRRAASHNV
jgi:putative flippase GtrA